MQHGTETVAQLWELLPYDNKSFPTLIEFKNRIKTWSPDNCPCRLCKMYLKNLGYIDVVNTFSET